MLTNVVIAGWAQPCFDEVFYFEKMEVNDFRNDVLLAEACRQDVDRYCKHVDPGAHPLLKGCWFMCAVVLPARPGMEASFLQSMEAPRTGICRACMCTAEMPCRDSMMEALRPGVAEHGGLKGRCCRAAS
jgi:hypothetical protein